MSAKYTFDDYNRHGALRTPPSLRFSMLVLLHQTILALIVVFSHGRGGKMGGGGASGLDYDTITYWPVLLELPAILVGYAMIQRTPKAKAWVRKLWPYCRRILQLGAIAELAGNGWVTWKLGMDDDFFVMNAMVLVGTALALGYLLVSPYLADYFADFPPPPAPKPDAEAKP